MDNPEVPQTVLMAALIANGATEVYTLYNNDNSRSRDLSMLQTQVLGLHMGLWGGRSRKIEIAEGFLQPPVTMLRPHGRFRAAHYPLVHAEVADTGSELKAKWMMWKRENSYRRLVFHLFLHDSQASMAAGQSSDFRSPDAIASTCFKEGLVCANTG
jgi:hypothetical protein